MRHEPSTTPGSTVSPSVRLRPGELHDIPAATALHDRCSPESLYHRFHAPVARISPRIARQLLAPTAGWSVVAEQGYRLVGLACAAPVSATHVEVGVLVEDRYQRFGIGTRLLHEVARTATTRGYTRLECHVVPDNPAALATVRRAAMVGHVTRNDGVLLVSIPVPRAHPDGLSEPA